MSFSHLAFVRAGFGTGPADVQPADERRVNYIEQIARFTRLHGNVKVRLQQM